MENNTVWLVAYIIRDYIGNVQKDLKKQGFDYVKVYIPTVKILKKQVKGKNIYEEVPLLFNYGFFGMPYERACELENLINMRKKVPCIYSWVKDTFSLFASKPQLRGDNKEFRKPDVAIVDENDIINLLKTSEYCSVFSEDSVSKLVKGDYLILKGYPYEGIPAEIIKIDKVDKSVKVKLLLENIIHEVNVSFDNVYYTVYADYDADSPLSSRNISIDDNTNSHNRNMNKLYASMSYGTEE
jgi:hypothetical protein